MVDVPLLQYSRLASLVQRPAKSPARSERSITSGCTCRLLMPPTINSSSDWISTTSLSATSSTTLSYEIFVLCANASFDPKLAPHRH